MTTRLLVVTAILVAVVLAALGTITVDSTVVIWLLIGMAVVIVIASMSGRSGAGASKAPQAAVIPAAPMPDPVEPVARAAEYTTAAATTPDAATEVVPAVPVAADAEDDVEIEADDDGAEVEPVEVAAADTDTPETDADRVAADADAEHDAADEISVPTEAPAEDSLDADIIDISRKRRPAFASEEDDDMTTISVPAPEVTEAPVSSIQLPKQKPEAKPVAPSLKVTPSKPAPAPTPTVALSPAPVTPTPAPTVRTEPTTPKPTAPAAPTPVPAAPAGSLAPKVSAATQKAIADLVDRGRLSSEGPITDTDVKTIVFLAISAQEVVALVDGGYVTESGGTTSDRSKAKPFQASA